MERFSFFFGRYTRPIVCTLVVVSKGLERGFFARLLGMRDTTLQEVSVTEQALGKLSEDQILAQLEQFPEWAELNGQIQRTFQFDDFDQSIAFVGRVAEYAEQVQHHPDILIRYNKVTLTISTHDAGGITHKDFELARTADAMI